MTQDARAAAKKRTALLKTLREQHPDSVERAKARLKDQRGLRRQICQQLRTGPKIVPELAEATGLPTSTVLWHITAMKKYDKVNEVGQCGEYYQYALAAEEDES
jgi:predicted transcriptional regulator